MIIWEFSFCQNLNKTVLLKRKKVNIRYFLEIEKKLFSTIFFYFYINNNENHIKNHKKVGI